MSSASWRRALLVAGIVAQPAAAQDLAILGRRVDSTFRAAVEARARLADYRKSHIPVNQWSDSAVIGGGRITVYFNADLADVGRAAARVADRQLQELGSALSATHPFVFSIVPDTAVTPYDRRLGRGGQINVRQHNANDPGNPNRNSTDRDSVAAARVIASAVERAAAATAPSEIDSWVTGQMPVLPRFLPKPDWGALRLAIVSSPSHLGRSCYQGDVRACRIVLGLDTVADPARMLFDSIGRRLVVGFELDRMTRASRTATQRCLDGNDDACIAVLNIGGISALSSPFVRNSIISHALTLGGERSAERLLTAKGSAGDALAAAANLPLDSVVHDWQSHLAQRSGTSANLPLTIAFSSLVWIAVCFFLALRSSRWR